MDTTAPTISTPTAARIAGLSPFYVRALLARRPTWPMVRWPRSQPRLSSLDVLRLSFVGRLTAASLSEADALDVGAGTIDARLFGFATCGLPIPFNVVLTALDGAAWHILPGTPPNVCRVQNGSPPGTAVCLTINAAVLAGNVFDNIKAAAAATKGTA